MSEKEHLILTLEEIAELAESLWEWDYRVEWINEDLADDLMVAGALIKTLLKNGMITASIDLPPVDELEERKTASVLKLVQKDYPKK